MSFFTPVAFLSHCAIKQIVCQADTSLKKKTAFNKAKTETLKLYLSVFKFTEV